MQQYHEQTDSCLVKSWIGSKDDNAYVEIYQRYKRDILNFVNIMLKNRHLSEEMMHDTFLVLVEKPSNFADVENLRPYLMGIANNLVRKHMGNRGLEISVEESLEESQVGNLADDGLDPFDELFNKDTIGIVKEIAEEIKTDYKKAFYLDVLGYTDKEIAQIMGLSSVKDARNLVERSRKTIKEKFKERMDQYARKK